VHALATVRELQASAAQQGVAADHQQLGSIDLGRSLAAYFGGRFGSGQRCCWTLNADPLGGASYAGVSPMRRTIGFALLFASALGAAIVTSRYLTFDDSAMPDFLVASFSERRLALYTHLVPGMVAILLGPIQFYSQRRNSPSFRPAASRCHIYLGRAYMLSSLIAGGTGLYLGLHAFGGFASQLGFVTLSALFVASTTMGWRAIRLGLVASHVEWMTRSYALVLGFVTIRVWQHVFPGGVTNPEAYAAATWFSFVPNLIFAEIVNYRRRAEFAIKED
jgi:hypothetical protein